jgi:DNA-binding NarL/FixJ family response regulator
MRVVLVGSATARARVRLQLGEGVEVVAEYPTLASARAGAANVDAVMLAHEPAEDTVTTDAEALTAREIQVLELLAEGLSNKGIGRRLDISDQTVKFHVAAITGKLGAANRTEAVRRAVRRGLITL